MTLHSLTRKLHWLGVLLLLAAAILLLLASITAPVINHLSLLQVNFNPDLYSYTFSVTFGSFGWCLTDISPIFNQPNRCTPPTLGYAPASTLDQIDHAVQFDNINTGTTEALTRALVLHPVAGTLAFLSFLLALPCTSLLTLLATLTAGLAWFFTLVVLACDFSLFGVLRRNVNKNGAASGAEFGAGVWCVVAAWVCLWGGMGVVFLSWFGERRERRKTTREKAVERGRVARKKRFGLF